MTRSQTNFVFLLVNILIYSFVVFRSDMIYFNHRPNLNNFLSSYGFHIISFSSIFAASFFLARLLKCKLVWTFGFFVIFELLLIAILFSGYKFFPQELKINNSFVPFKVLGNNIRPTIQFEANISKFDPEVFYTLKPGKSRFESFEFDIPLFVNTKGLRDDEKSLNKPKVIFLGDSFTMGWGVNQEESFASVFEKKTQINTLNAGISSYGTAREYLMLKRLDIDSTKLIVIQFHDTDFEENKYFNANNSLPKRDKWFFDQNVKNNMQAKVYYPFKYFNSFVKNLVFYFKELRNAHRGMNVYENGAKDFYDIISRIQKIYKGKILITYLGSFQTTNTCIVAFKNYAAKNDIKNVEFIDFSKKLNHKDYFFYDDHLNKYGHKVVGREMATWYENMIKSGKLN